MAIGWIIIAVVILLFLVAVFKTQDLIFIYSLIKKYFFLIVFVALILFLSFSVYRIHTNYDISLTSFEGFKGAGKLYLSWLKNVFSNIGKVTGYAVNQDWTAINSTNLTK